MLAAAAEGEGTHAAVFLHQTSSSGFCGWVTYAGWAADQGIRAVLLDLCAWGRSKCQPGLTGDPAGQVRLAVNWARERGATSVTVVGASLGGVTALAVGQDAGADAIVDLSGPFSYAGLDSADAAAARISVPLLVAMAPNDAQMEPAKVKDAFGTAPASGQALPRARRRTRLGDAQRRHRRRPGVDAVGRHRAPVGEGRLRRLSLGCLAR